METILEILIVLIHWRLLLCVGGALTISVFLARYISWFGLGFGLCFTLLAVGFGIIWQSRAEAGIPLFAKIENPKISKPIAVLGLLFIAAIWYGVFSSIFSPVIGGLIVSASFVLGVVVYYKKTSNPSFKRDALRRPLTQTLAIMPITATKIDLLSRHWDLLPLPKQAVARWLCESWARSGERMPRQLHEYGNCSPLILWHHLPLKLSSEN